MSKTSAKTKPASTVGRVFQVTVYPADEAAIRAIVADMTRPGSKPPAMADAVRDAIHERAAKIGNGK